jgi:hypothetical protein
MEDGTARIWKWMEHAVSPKGHHNARVTDSIVLHCGSHDVVVTESVGGGGGGGGGRSGRGRTKSPFVSVDTVVWGAHDKLVVTAQSLTPIPSSSTTWVVETEHDYQVFFFISYF